MAALVDKDDDSPMYWGHCNGVDPASPPWTLRLMEGRGYCAFAARRFEAGELILVERPTVWVRGHHPFTAAQVAEVERAVAALPAAERRAFDAMANVFAPAESGGSTAAGIFMTNSFEMAGSMHGDCCAMYLAIARLNHSCVPNAQQTHLPATGEEVLHASRAIDVGEEVCDCYIDLRQSRADRQRNLQELFRFTCACAACTMPPDPRADDAWRVRAGRFEDEGILAAEAGDVPLALEVVLGGVKLLESAGNLPWSIRYCAAAHVAAHQLYAAMGERGMSAAHAASAHRYNLMLQGPSSPDTLHTAELFREATAT